MSEPGEEAGYPARLAFATEDDPPDRPDPDDPVIRVGHPPVYLDCASVMPRRTRFQARIHLRRTHRPRRVRCYLCGKWARLEVADD